MNKERKIELMSPAGDFESLMAALQAGADSIYFGVEQLNMRARSTVNFTLEDLPEIVKRCSQTGTRTYLTLNTVLYDHDIKIMQSLIDKAHKAGITAIIASDIAAILYARQIGMEVHISTQQNVSNIEAVKFFSQWAETIVLARELSLHQTKKIVEEIEKQNIISPSGKPVEIEIFIHGALCMAVSGKCYLSLHSYNSSANRGACKQNCRKAYSVTEKESGEELLVDNEYIMSPKDLCVLPFLDKVIDTGVKVLKIEGRGRSPEYVYTATKVYKQAIASCLDGTFNKEKVENWQSELDNVYNRGFWGGYYLGQKLGQWSDKPGSCAKQKKTYLAKGLHFYPKSSIGEFLVEAYDIKIGDQIVVSGPTTGIEFFEIKSMQVNDKEVGVAKKGDRVTIPLTFRLRPSDKLYKIEQNII